MDAQAMIARAKEVRARLMTPPNGRVSSELEIVSEAIQRRQVSDSAHAARQAAIEARRRLMAEACAKKWEEVLTQPRDDGIVLEKTLHVRHICRAVADHYGIQLNMMMSVRRLAILTYPRQVAMYLCRCLLTSLSWQQIGTVFNRDHTTVLHAVRKISELVENNEKLAADLIAIRANLGVD